MCLSRRRSLRSARHIRRRSLLRFSCVAYRACLRRRRSLRSARHMAASLITPLLLRCKRRVPAAPSPPFAALVTRRRRSLLCFSCIAFRVCLRRRRSLRFARHMTASLIASLLLRRKLCVPVAPSVPSLRSSHTASFIASLLLCRKRHVPVAPSVPSLRSSHTAPLTASLLLRCISRVPEAPSVRSLRSSHGGVAHCSASLALPAACTCSAVAPLRCARHTAASLIALLL